MVRQTVPADHMVSERPVAQIDFKAWIPRSFTASPDGRRVAYAAIAGRVEGVMVVDGVKGKQYGTIASPPVFSPDSQRVAYVAGEGDKRFVVIDGQEGKRYDGAPGGLPEDAPDGVPKGAPGGAPPGGPVFSPNRSSWGCYTSCAKPSEAKLK